MGDVGTQFDVVELLFVEVVGEVLTAAIPCHFVTGVVEVDVCCESRHLVRRGIAAHEADAGDALALGGHHGVDGLGVEREAVVAPELRAVAAWAVAGAAGNIDGQGGLVWDFLEDDVGVEVFKHCGNSDGGLPPAALERSCRCVSGSR